MKIKTSVFNIVRAIFKVPFLEKWLRRKTLNATPENLLYKLVPNNYQYKPNSIRTFNYKGVNLSVDIRDYVGHFLYFGFKDGAHEKLMNLCKPDYTVLDIGTNIGSTLLQFANKIGEKGKVYGFEPDPTNYQACKNNISLNSFHNLEVANIGLGDKKGSFNLVVDTETNRGGNRISFENESQKTSTTIQVERLDDWVINKYINHVDLIKIDVEGFEMNVLKGAEEILKKHNPTLFIELDNNNLKQVESNAKDLILFLEKLNYQMINAESNLKVTSTDNFSNCHFDIICTKNT
jgi:FkbM family methyltransferase